MKKLILALAMLLALGGVVIASPVGACDMSTNMATYLTSNYACTIDGFTFSNFFFNPSAQGGALALDPTGVVVDTMGPSGADVFDSNVGFELNFNQSAGPNQASDFSWGFQVSVPGGVMFEDAALAQLAGATGTGIASVVEKGCGPTPCTPGQWDLLTLDSSTLSSSGTDIIYSPTGTLSVEKDVGVNGGTGGFVQMSQLQETFSSAPEPATMFGTGGVLIALGVFLRRQRRKASR